MEHYRRISPTSPPLIPLDIEESCSYLLRLPHTQRVFAHVKRLSFMTVRGFIEPPLKYYLDTRDALEQGGVERALLIDVLPTKRIWPRFSI